MIALHERQLQLQQVGRADAQLEVSVPHSGSGAGSTSLTLRTLKVGLNLLSITQKYTRISQ